MGNGRTVTIEMIYNKLAGIEKRLGNVERRLSIPETKLSKKELGMLEKAREEIRKGNYLTEKELFSILSE